MVSAPARAGRPKVNRPRGPSSASRWHKRAPHGASPSRGNAGPPAAVPGCGRGTYRRLQLVGPDV